MPGSDQSPLRADNSTVTASAGPIGAAVFALACTCLTACGSDSSIDSHSSDSTQIVESSDAVTGGLPRFDSLSALRDSLAGTDWECRNWSDANDGAASCVVLSDTGSPQAATSIHGVYLNDHPAETASVIFQSTPDTPAVIVGNNWLFDCGPDPAFGVDRCGSIAGILGGTVVLPDPA